MTLSDRINKAIDARKAKSEAQKYAWQKVSDGHARKQLVTEECEQPVFIHVVGDDVYRSDSDLVNVEEIIGQEAEEHLASAKATMALRSTQAGSSGGLAGLGKSLLSAAEGMSSAVAEGEMETHHPRNQQPTSNHSAPHPLEGLVSMPSQEREKTRKQPQTYEEWMGF